MFDNIWPCCFLHQIAYISLISWPIEFILLDPQKYEFGLSSNGCLAIFDFGVVDSHIKLHISYSFLYCLHSFNLVNKIWKDAILPIPTQTLFRFAFYQRPVDKQPLHSTQSSYFGL